MYSLQDIIQYYKKYGILETMSKILNELFIFLFAFIFAILDRRVQSEENTVCIVPRSFSIDQDTIGILTEAGNDINITIAVSELSNHDEKILEKFDERNVTIVRIHSLKFLELLSVSKVVVFKDVLWQYRLLSNKDKRFIRIPHGLPAKKPQVDCDTNCTPKDILSNKIDLGQNYEYAVGSELEYHREIGVMGRSPANLKKYGYPRYNRVRKVLDDPTKTLVSRQSYNSLKDSDVSHNILYAPTHKDDAFETELFPFPDFDKKQLIDYLSSNNIKIYVRMHPNEERNGIAEEYIDGKNILYAGQQFSRSAIELFPFFDALITDYSSIYLDYILTDRPIIFVQDRLDEFKDLRGFVFDYEQYWPGPKVENQKQFQSNITKLVVEQENEYSYERQFVRDTFHPKQSHSFLKNVLNKPVKEEN